MAWREPDGQGESWLVQLVTPLERAADAGRSGMTSRLPSARGWRSEACVHGRA
jgi:hypothetical protein